MAPEQRLLGDRRNGRGDQQQGGAQAWGSSEHLRSRIALVRGLSAGGGTFDEAAGLLQHGGEDALQGRGVERSSRRSLGKLPCHRLFALRIERRQALAALVDADRRGQGGAFLQQREQAAVAVVDGGAQGLQVA